MRLLHRLNDEIVDACWEAGIERMKVFVDLREESNARSHADRVQDLLGSSLRRHSGALIKPGRLLVAEGQTVRVEPRGHFWRATHHHRWGVCAISLQQLGAQ